ncbi:hypothetical protein AVEN_80152-1 [Araneus ventricosus]|uniref:Uncharacterized protein n=1 Tax=Araneus ventricosus TaxID=182803 RepID=A0A4Y2LNT7_ARAVE|nr:hypothetical protein AVEN_80152-1 [Araneus ventricosus]
MSYSCIHLPGFKRGYLYYQRYADVTFTALCYLFIFMVTPKHSPWCTKFSKVRINPAFSGLTKSTDRNPIQHIWDNLGKLLVGTPRSLQRTLQGAENAFLQKQERI